MYVVHEKTKCSYMFESIVYKDMHIQYCTDSFYFSCFNQVLFLHLKMLTSKSTSTPQPLDGTLLTLQ